jgi:lipid-A-disaccharide synthase-like uncharacterized protein
VKTGSKSAAPAPAALSLAGSMLLLAYAVHRKDPVFVLGQAFGWIVYSRNLMLIQRQAS